MTTIAFDGRYLAADTLGVRGGNRVEQPLCKLQVSGGHAFATGGQFWAIAGELIDWHAAGHPIADYPNPRGLDGCLVVVDGDTRQCKVFTHEAPYPDLEAAPIAFGTGGDIALGAMGAGLTAMEAVALAARWDLKTGGPIDFIDLEWIDNGVQRWDGVMPSAKFPMPLNAPLEDALGPNMLAESKRQIYALTGKGKTGKMEFETVEIPKPVVTATGATCRGSYVFGTACRQCERCLAEWHILHKHGQDEDFAVSLLPKGFTVTGNGKTARREVVDELRKVPFTLQNCVHGMKLDTCSTCRANRTANLYPV